MPFNAKNEAALPVKKIIKFAMGEGLYISAYSNIIRLAPPLIISPEELNFAGQVLDRALDIADEYVE